MILRRSAVCPGLQSGAGQRKEGREFASLTIASRIVVRRLSPEWFMMENVIQGSESRRRGSRLGPCFKAGGVWAHRSKINAAFYGCSSIRRRFLCNRSGLGERDGFPAIRIARCGIGDTYDLAANFFGPSTPDAMLLRKRHQDARRSDVLFRRAGHRTFASVDKVHPGLYSHIPPTRPCSQMGLCIRVHVRDGRVVGSINGALSDCDTGPRGSTCSKNIFSSIRTRRSGTRRHRLPANTQRTASRITRTSLRLSDGCQRTARHLQMIATRRGPAPCGKGHRARFILAGTSHGHSYLRSGLGF